VKRRKRISSQSNGVSWDKGPGKWKATCERKTLGFHATEEGAARVYNVEAERLGLPLNVIPPAGDAHLHPDHGSHTAAPAAALAVPRPAAHEHAHADAASKRAASTSLASPQTKQMRLDTSAGVAGATAAAAAAAHRAELEAGIINEEDEGEEEEEDDSYEEAEETQAGEEEGEGRRELHAQAPDASLDRHLEVGSGARRARLALGGYPVNVAERDNDDEEEQVEEDQAEEEGGRGQEEREETDVYERLITEYEEEEGEEEKVEEETEEAGDDGNAGRGATIGEADDRPSSQVVGVSWHPSKKKWQAHKYEGGRKIWLGRHVTQEAAAKAIDDFTKVGVDPVKHREGTSSLFKVSRCRLTLSNLR